MRISKIFNLKKSQYELDFVDIDTDTDIPLFLDPYFISKMEFPLAKKAYLTIKSFFDFLLALLQQDRLEEAREIFSYLGESNEICMGMSKHKPSGKGMGPTDAERIFQSLLKSEGFKTGLMEDIEDLRIFVHNVDKDKISDMTANIIRKHLIEYTQMQCDLWNIPMEESVPSGYFWNSKIKDWDIEYTRMLVIDGRKIILVPKRLVSYAKYYSSDQYFNHFAVNYLQNDHLRLQTSLVKERKSKEKYVTKKDVIKYIKKTESIDKNWLARFTLNYPDVFKDFKKKSYKKIKYVTNEELDDTDINDIVSYLKNELVNTSPGHDSATKYHKLMVSIIELLFYPNLCAPMIEQKIHDGRKRIDIVYQNCAEEGFFFRLRTIHDIPSSNVFVECKNYSRDIANPELDQLSGRYSNNRGKFGIAACRKIDDFDLIMQKCADTYKDGRGVIIPITDEDIIMLLDNFTLNPNCADDFMQKRFSALSIT